MAVVTWIVVAVVVALLFVLAGGTLAGIRPYLENRSNARAIADQELREQAATAEAEEVRRRAEADHRMRVDPVPVLTATLAHYVEQVRTPRNAAANAANVVRLDRAQQYIDEVEQLPQSLRQSGTTRYAVLAAVPLFVAGSVVAGVLDFMTFRGFSGGFTLPALLSILTVLIMTVSSVLIGLGMGWHKGLAGAEWSRFRRGVIARIGVVVAIVGLVAMTWIAPNRTRGGHDAEIGKIRSDIAWLDSIQPPSADITAQTTKARQDLARAQSAERLAAAVDRVSVGGITFLEIPLTEGMLLGAQVLMCLRARQRRDEAQRHHRTSLDAIEQADSRVRAEMLDLLARYGHGVEPLRLALMRIQEVDLTWNGLVDPPTLDTQPTGGPDPSPAEMPEPKAENTEPEATPQPRSKAAQLLDGLDELDTKQQGTEGDS